MDRRLVRGQASSTFVFVVVATYFIGVCTIDPEKRKENVKDRQVYILTLRK